MMVRGSVSEGWTRSDCFRTQVHGEDGLARLRWPVVTRRVHKWLGLFVAVQAVIWTLSGLYMTAVHIDIIHGDHFVRSAKPSPVKASELVSPVAAASVLPGAQSVKLSWLADRPVYVVRSKEGCPSRRCQQWSGAPAADGGRHPPSGETLVHRRGAARKGESHLRGA